MEVRFGKAAEGRVCSWEALRPPRTRVPGSAMAAGGDVPHDLATFVIEQALGIEHGFWGCVAEGATFDSMGRRVTAEGRAVVRRYTTELAEAEAIVNAHHFGWRAGEGTPVDDVLDATLAEWRALPEGAELVRQWQRTPARRRGRR